MMLPTPTDPSPGAAIPLERLPGFAQWGRGLGELLDRPEPLWVHGPAGSGVSTVARLLAERRGTGLLEDADRLDEDRQAAWLQAHPGGILAAHAAPGGALAGRVVALALWALDEDPAALPGCLESLARAEGLEGPLPTALGRLPCPANLLGLRNRVLRWRLLGQPPEDPAAQAPALPLEEDNLALNLHHLERLLLHRALRRAYGNRVEAARRLGVSRRQLYLLVARHGDPVRGEASTGAEPKRLVRRQNSSP